MFKMDDMTRAGCTSRRGVRFWEEKGLLGEVERSANNQRRYTDEQLRRARIIAAAQFCGWNLDEIQEMLTAYDHETYVAIVTRLSNVTRTAVTLGEGLPEPEGEIEEVEQEYDL